MYVVANRGLKAFFLTTEGFRRSFLFFAPGFLISLAVILLFGNAVAGYLTRGVREMTDVLLRFSRGDFSVRFRSDTQTELSMVRSSLNSMADRVVKYENELQQTTGERSRVLAALIHDLTRPVAALSLAIENIRGSFGEKLSVDWRNRIAVPVKEQESLFRSLSELTSEELQSGEEFSKVNLSGLCRAACESFTPLARSKDLVLQVQLNDGPVHVSGVERLLSRLLSNLLDNAIRYTPAGGVVTVRCGERDEGVSLEVEDTGIGVDENSLRALSQYFTRGAEGRRMNPHGSGIGLAVAQSVVNLHGGEFSARRAEKQGSIFSCVFPSIERRGKTQRLIFEDPARSDLGQREVVPAEFLQSAFAGVTIVLAALLPVLAYFFDIKEGGGLVVLWLVGNIGFAVGFARQVKTGVRSPWISRLQIAGLGGLWCWGWWALFSGVNSLLVLQGFYGGAGLVLGMNFLYRGAKGEYASLIFAFFLPIIGFLVYNARALEVAIFASFFLGSLMISWKWRTPRLERIAGRASIIAFAILSFALVIEAFIFSLASKRVVLDGVPALSESTLKTIRQQFEAAIAGGAGDDALRNLVYRVTSYQPRLDLTLFCDIERCGASAWNNSQWVEPFGYLRSTLKIEPGEMSLEHGSAGKAFAFFPLGKYTELLVTAEPELSTQAFTNVGQLYLFFWILGSYFVIMFQTNYFKYFYLRPLGDRLRLLDSRISQLENLELESPRENRRDEIDVCFSVARQLSQRLAASRRELLNRDEELRRIIGQILRAMEGAALKFRNILGASGSTDEEILARLADENTRQKKFLDGVFRFSLLQASEASATETSDAEPFLEDTLLEFLRQTPDMKDVNCRVSASAGDTITGNQEVLSYVVLLLLQQVLDASKSVHPLTKQCEIVLESSSQGGIHIRENISAGNGANDLVSDPWNGFARILLRKIGWTLELDRGANGSRLVMSPLGTQ